MERFAGSPERDNGTTSTDELIGAVRELIALMGKGGIAELDLTSGDMTIRLRGASQVSVAQVAASAPVESNADGASAESGYVITAPMIGTYYAASSPGDDPFVRVGDEVEIGQVVGIIEAMKIMNEIVSDRAGVVSEILVENAQAVEYGSPLVRLTEQTDAFL